MATLPMPPRPQRLRQIELPEREIMTVQEVAEYLRCTSHHVTNLATRGEIPGRKFGKLWRFNRKTILGMM